MIRYNIDTVFDYGCGDGNQVSLFKGFKKYYGYDISPYIINKNQEIFKHYDHLIFINNLQEIPKVDLCISFDVIYHLIEDNDFEEYMYNLFYYSKKYVLIFSTNHSNNNKSKPHIFHRKFTKWINFNVDVNLIEEIKNYSLGTNAHFFLYEKK